MSGKEFYMLENFGEGVLFDNKDNLPPMPPDGYVYYWEYMGHRNKDGSITPAPQGQKGAGNFIANTTPMPPAAQAALQSQPMPGLDMSSFNPLAMATQQYPGVQPLPQAIPQQQTLPVQTPVQTPAMQPQAYPGMTPSMTVLDSSQTPAMQPLYQSVPAAPVMPQPAAFPQTQLPAQPVPVEMPTSAAGAMPQPVPVTMTAPGMAGLSMYNPPIEPAAKENGTAVQILSQPQYFSYDQQSLVQPSAAATPTPYMMPAGSQQPMPEVAQGHQMIFAPATATVQGAVPVPATSNVPEIESAPATVPQQYYVQPQTVEQQLQAGATQVFSMPPSTFAGASGSAGPVPAGSRALTDEECKAYGVPLGSTWKDEPANKDVETPAKTLDKIPPQAYIQGQIAYMPGTTPHTPIMYGGYMPAGAYNTTAEAKKDD